MMKKIYLLALAAMLPAQTMAVENDSVYAWGAWEEGIQPAAGPVARITPPPAQKPDVNFRPNENSAFLREAVQIPNITPGLPTSNIISGVGDISPGAVLTPPPSRSTPPPPVIN